MPVMRTLLVILAGLILSFAFAFGSALLVEAITGSTGFFARELGRYIGLLPVYLVSALVTRGIGMFRNAPAILIWLHFSQIGEYMESPFLETGEVAPQDYRTLLNLHAFVLAIIETATVVFIINTALRGAKSFGRAALHSVEPKAMREVIASPLRFLTIPAITTGLQATQETVSEFYLIWAIASINPKWAIASVNREIGMTEPVLIAALVIEAAAGGAYIGAVFGGIGAGGQYLGQKIEKYRERKTRRL